jgi:SH3-like domain-containing protein
MSHPRPRRRSPVSGPAALLLALGWLLAAADSAQAQTQTGASGLPLPRFVSLKSDRVNLRAGPAQDHEVTWIYTRAGLPVEITAEFENWRRIRDSEGTEGWVFHSLLSGRRTALVAPWSKERTLPLRRDRGETAKVVALLEPGVLVDVAECDGVYCRVSVANVRGWMPQEQLWGVYPDEAFKQ